MVRDTAATRLTLGALLVASFTLASIDSQSGDGSSPLHPVRSAAATVLGPLQSGLATLTAPVSGTVDAVADSRGQAERLAALEASNAALQVELRGALARGADQAAGTDLTSAAAEAGARVEVARVLAVNAAPGYAWTIAIDRGSADDVAVDSAVLDAAGVVGRVIAVSEHSATVLLAADPLSSIGIRMAGSGEIGRLDGTGEQVLRLELFNRSARIAPGDDLVTFGSAGARPYAADLPVGRVVTVTARPGGLGPVATVRPYARLTALDVVGVVLGGRAQPANAADNAAPTTP